MFMLTVLKAEEKSVNKILERERLWSMFLGTVFAFYVSSSGSSLSATEEVSSHTLSVPCICSMHVHRTDVNATGL